MTDLAPIEPMTESDARLVTGHLRNLIHSVQEKIDQIADLLAKAYDRRAWVALGYESWDAYVSAELRTDRLRLDRDDRQELVVQLRSAGMATRAIGSSVGASEGTVRNDLRDSGAQNYAPGSVTGTDGKTYPATQPPRGCSTCGGTEDHLPDCALIPQTPRARDLPQADPPAVEDSAVPAPSASLTDDQISEAVADTSADYRDAVYRKNLSKHVRDAQALSQHDPARVVEVADALTFEVIDNAARSIAAWHEQISKLRSRPLRVVDGGRA